MNIPVTFDMVVTYRPEFDIAASDLSGFKLPDGPVISGDRAKITQSMIDDFEAFMDDVEILCEVNYDLIGVYKNVSDDHSHYYNYLAKDRDGNIIVRFRFRLRISNHDARRSKQQQHNKKQELRSEKLNELLTEKQINNIKSYTRVITVNDKEFTSYRAAFQKIDETIERAVAVMRGERED